jgi:hypothetical protein
MMRFGFFTLNGRLTVYDVTQEWLHGRPVFVAALSEDPRVCFKAVRQENAVAQLEAYLTDLTHPGRRPAVTWIQQTAPTLSGR